MIHFFLFSLSPDTLYPRPRRVEVTPRHTVGQLCLFRNLANLGKSRSLDTEEAECSALTSCPHTAEATCRTCGGDSARDLELNKVSTGSANIGSWEHSTFLQTRNN